MKYVSRRSSLFASLASIACIGSLWSTHSLACSTEPIVSSICIMSASGAQYAAGFSSVYTAANGNLLPVSQNAALFSLIGTTYGGDGRTNFALPDLRGRTIIGAGANTRDNANYNIGQVGGGSTILTANQIPAHAHTLTTGATGVIVTTATGTLAANTTLSGLNITTNLAGIPFTSSNNTLALQASNGGTLTNNPSGKSLATTVATGVVKIYSDAAPSVGMMAGSISGTVSGTLSGTAPASVTGGSAQTSLTGAPAVTISGVTGPNQGAANAAIPTLPPYLVLRYYIATGGIYPSTN